MAVAQRTLQDFNILKQRHLLENILLYKTRAFKTCFLWHLVPSLPFSQHIAKSSPVLRRWQGM